ncbi:MAG: sensor histidine kinase N-terminal domain-containing protein [Gammaproteobacteria bacterium]|nr:sensor histidine kinase N-terminal domain-containing protein [Gammaproteobacteria bacterium]MCW5582766.1 sensor histidine kinase N-terminal domain-containing protein [Gammaproteobacteria bacterium]
MIKSIKYFLLISLLLSITIASAINGIGNYLLDEQVIQPYLDNQLISVSSLITILNQSSNPKIRADIIQYLRTSQPIIKQKFLFQVWSQSGELLLSLPHQPPLSLENAPLGFSDQDIHGNNWRTYATYDDKMHVKIIVAELYNLRRKLADDIAKSNANILLITYPVFGLLVWFIVNLALRSITKVTTEISNRASTFLEPVHLAEIPVEIKPLVAELNQLFIRLKLAFERNKRFAADAAHELRTPLAALKTHAQVALKSDNETDRSKALQKVIESVNRSSHVVAQLLTLSRLGEEETLTDIKPLGLHKLATEIIAYLAPHAFEKNIEIELTPSPAEPIVMGNDTALGILIRNVVDNAIRYTPPYGEVKISIIDTGVQVILRVIDTGPGIPLELRERVFERFYRVLGTKASGSGLGLAIVNQITTLHHGTIHLTIPPNGIGLQFDVAFPKYHA